jgi:predicted nuclease of predicted toxin-antitoxin system
MRFLVDECTGSRVRSWLAEIGHEVLSIYDEARGLTDDEILTKAFAESWILITNDKDFGELVFRERRPHHGVVFLRLEDERSIAKISALKKLLENYADRIPNRFVVVTDSQVRFAD